MVRVLILGLGMVGTTFSVGLERIKKGEIKPYGVPLADMDLGIRIDEIEIVGAIDVDKRKVGLSIYDVAKRIYNMESVPETLKEVKVYPGLGGEFVKDLFPIYELKGDHKEILETVYSTLKDLKPDVIVDVTTTQEGKIYNTWEDYERDVLEGKAAPSQVYAYLALKYAGEVKPVAYINLIPTPVANNPVIVAAAEKAGAIVLGDDGATGATPLTADILEHLRERNRKVYSIAQFNIGGNTDFLALLNERRNKAKKETKSSVVKDILGYDAPHFIRPTGYLEPLGDKKFVAMHILYESFNGAIDEIIVNMRINDSPALAGLIVDLARLAKLALDAGLTGTIYEINAFFMKRPAPLGSKNMARILAYQQLVNFIEKIKQEEVIEEEEKVPV
ncbi:MAG: myo-inositol-1-phosphate synthase [Thermoprotei archaeon]|nr:MAG: myo-inositol-1-phosphate synthase [Thermoprotei archaeon]